MTEKQIELTKKLIEIIDLIVSDPDDYSAEYIVDNYLLDIAVSDEWKDK